jgi:hypothetical protein
VEIDFFAVALEMCLELVFSLQFVLRLEGAALNKILEKSLPSYSTVILLDQR